MSSSPISSSDVSTHPRQFFDIRVVGRSLLQRQSWFLAFLFFDILIIYAIRTNSVLTDAWDYILPGISLTIQITVISFLFATLLGLIAAFGRISKNIFIYNLSTFYVELFRGLPLLVIILIFAFVVAPGLIDAIAGPGPTPNVPFLDDLLQRLAGISEDQIGTTILRTRDIDMGWRIMLAFAIAYGAFMTEVFRAGIESIGRGQMEAARSLGMTYFQAMRHVILPQAIRNVLPAMVNNFVFLLKDTSLASTVAVPEISQLTRQYSSNQFRYPEGLLVLAFIYANLTTVLSMAAYYLENRLHADRRED